MQVSEIMTPQVDVIDPNTMIRDAAVKMRDDDVGALPVGEDDRLIGMITDRDIVCRGVATDRGGGTTAVREVMSSRIFYCQDQDPVERASELMASHKVRRLPVVNSQKRLVGMVSLADLSHAGKEAGDAAEEALAKITEPSPHEPRK